jgi:hypothetical protein
LLLNDESYQFEEFHEKFQNKSEKSNPELREVDHFQEKFENKSSKSTPQAEYE